MNKFTCNKRHTPQQAGFDGDKGCGNPQPNTGCEPVEAKCLTQDSLNLEVAVWDDPGCDGDNVVRMFNEGQCTYRDGYFYWSLTDLNVDMPPSPKWTTGVSKCRMLLPSTILHDCDGLALSDGFRVPSCADVEALADKVDNAQEQLVQACSGSNLTSASRVVTEDQIGRGLWWNPSSCQVEAIASSIPTGCQSFVSSVSGSFATVIADETPRYTDSLGASFYDIHPEGSLTWTVADYPYLGVAGRKVCVKVDSNMGYALTDPNDRIGAGSYAQTDLWLEVNGSVVRGPGDGYFLNGDGQDHESGTSGCVCFETTGEDLVMTAVRTLRYEGTDLNGDAIDPTGVIMYVDVAEISGVFSDGTLV